MTGDNIPNANGSIIVGNSKMPACRIHREERIELPRRKASVETPYGVIEVKVATRPGGGEMIGPEYESCKRAAQEAGVSLLDVYESVRKAWDEKGR